MELEDLDNELWLKEYKKKRRAHVQEIVDASILSEQEKEWMEEYSPQVTTDITYNDKENRYEERSQCLISLICAQKTIIKNLF